MSRAIRFEPDPFDVALIDTVNSGTSFNPIAIALILNESFTGCALVVKSTNEFVANQIIKIKVGNMAQLKAKIVWIKKIEDSILKIGIEFLE